VEEKKKKGVWQQLTSDFLLLFWFKKVGCLVARVGVCYFPFLSMYSLSQNILGNHSSKKYFSFKIFFKIWSVQKITNIFYIFIKL
jgi:hypothetical protein